MDKRIIDLLSADVAEGAREYGRRRRKGAKQDAWTRNCINQYQLLRLDVVPGARAQNQAYYAQRVGRPVRPTKRKYS